ncbi:phosphonate C-P lyase system protein PhnL [Ideonella sp. A 288]|uniref:phosphonate C-P lyase system protein PhnL n=1 Tax=Ideonella sp. A 288 TaxID=1962181 RepID=UPI000B4A63BC|nr:phosphonate C-P lyase system protein PhnL [Ideonella sp. A 288]
MRPTPVLSVQGLAKRFTLHLRGGQVLPVLQDVSLQVGAGECVALVGASGQGKSTLIKCLHGSYGIDAGQAWLQSEAGAVDLAQATPQQVLALRRREIACVSQFLRVLPRVSTLGLVVERALQAQPAPAASADDGDDLAQRTARARLAAGALLQRLNLPEPLWGLPPATFSGGEQQRVNIARGFIAPARLLLLDEPTASLDAANRRVVIGLIDEAKAAGTAIVGIFHDEEVRDAVATRCVNLVAPIVEPA